jgi:hypothetical protein
VNTALGEEVLVPLTVVKSAEPLARVVWDLWYRTVPALLGRSAYAGLDISAVRACERLDRDRVFGDFLFFHGLELEPSEWRIEPDQIRGWSSDPGWLVSHLLDDPEHGKNMLIDREIAPTVLQRLLATPGRDRRFAANAIRDLIHRATFHQALADALGIIYEPSFARIPAMAHLHGNSVQIALGVADIELLRELVLERAHAEARAGLSAATTPMPIPPLSAYVLARISTPMQWWEVVGELRERANGYWAKRRDLQQAIFTDDVRTIRQLRAEVLGASTGLSDALVDTGLDAVTEVATTAATLAPGSPAAFVGPSRS